MTNVFPTADLSKLFELAEKLVDLNVAKFETAVKAQTAATRSFVELTATRVKAASEVIDYAGLMGFTQEQTKIMQSSMEKLMADCKSTTEDTVTYGKEVQQILNQSVATVKPAAKKAA